MVADIVRAARECCEEVEFLLSAVACAAFSSRFATLLQPVPAPEVFLDRLTGECDIVSIRAALDGLPASPRDLAREDIVTTLPHHTICLVRYFLFGSSGSALALQKIVSRYPVSDDTVHVRLTMSPARQFPLQPSERTVRNRRTFELDSGTMGTFESFHGAPGAAWYSILHNGLLESADDPANVSTGRAYGDGLYLAEQLAICIPFAPPSRIWLKPQWPRSLAAIGVFDVIASNVVRRAPMDRTLPKHFVVADEASVALREIRVLACVGASVRRGNGSCSALLIVYAICLIALGGGAVSMLNMFISP
jgi:hypothetical protein